MEIDKLKEEAVGRWDGIFNSLGIEVGDGKHRSCPVCGGLDRFRFSDKDGRGMWYCSQCPGNAGDGFRLVENFFKVDFVEACKIVAGVVGHCEVNNKPKEPQITKEKLNEIFGNSEPCSRNNIAGKYLFNRGLDTFSNKLRSTRKCWCAERKGEFPAMLSVFTLPDSTAVTMHRTYIDEHGDKASIDQPKKMLPALQSITGGCVRLFDIAEEMGVGEGIETMLAVHEENGLPVLATTTAILLEKFEPPAGIKILHIFGDNDKSFTGQKAAYALANRLVTNKNKYRDIENVFVYIPPKPKFDWLDVLLQNK